MTKACQFLQFTAMLHARGWLLRLRRLGRKAADWRKAEALVVITLASKEISQFASVMLRRISES
jgi:hypothetical protein